MIPRTDHDSRVRSQWGRYNLPRWSNLAELRVVPWHLDTSKTNKVFGMLVDSCWFTCLPKGQNWMNLLSSLCCKDMGSYSWDMIYFEEQTWVYYVRLFITFDRLMTIVGGLHASIGIKKWIGTKLEQVDTWFKYWYLDAIGSMSLVTESMMQVAQPRGKAIISVPNWQMQNRIINWNALPIANLRYLETLPFAPKSPCFKSDNFLPPFTPSMTPM